MAQQNNFNKNDYLTLVNATKQIQVTAANSTRNNSEIYEVTWKVNRNFFIKKILGEIDNLRLKGKLIYNNVITDSAYIIKGTKLVMRLEKNANKIKLNADKTNKPGGCNSRKKLTMSNENVIQLSFFADNHLAVFNVNLKEKKIQADAQLPQ